MMHDGARMVIATERHRVWDERQRRGEATPLCFVGCRIDTNMDRARRKTKAEPAEPSTESPNHRTPNATHLPLDEVHHLPPYHR
jgi:hypothetical protein